MVIPRRRWSQGPCLGLFFQIYFIFNDRTKLSEFGHDVRKDRLANIVTASFNIVTGQMILLRDKWSERLREKNCRRNFLVKVRTPKRTSRASATWFIIIVIAMPREVFAGNLPDRGRA